MSKIPGAARSDKAKETHMDKLTPFFKKKKRILKKGLTKRGKAGILTERLTEGMKKQESGRKRPGRSRMQVKHYYEENARKREIMKEHPERYTVLKVHDINRKIL